jgi:hypothetical protein
VPPDGLLRLADGIGAATLSFGSPPDNPADLAPRLIADHVGQRRAGPTLFSSVAADPTGRALIEAQIYLADRTGRHPIPQDPSLFIYAQPEHVKDSLEQPWVVTPPTPATSATGTLPLPGFSGDDEELPDEPAERYYADKTTVPGWVAASHRYLSTESAHLSRVLESSGDVPVESAYDLGAAEALAEIRSIVARHSGSS